MGIFYSSNVEINEEDKEDSIIFIEEEDIMEQDIIMPVEQDIIMPVEQDIIMPVEQDIIMPVEQDIMEQDIIMPVEQDIIMPVEQDIIMPVEQDIIMPVEQDIMEQDIIMPVEQDIMEQDIIMPVEQDTIMPTVYVYNNIKYIHAFPKSWARNHISDTGPESCAMCVSYGTVDGIFVGYCSACARLYHDYERGLGFIDNDYSEATVDVDYLLNSVFLTYLKDVELPYDYSDMPDLIIEL